LIFSSLILELKLMKLIYFYRFIYNEEYAYLCVGNNNTPPPPKSVLSIFCTDPG